MIIIGDDRYAQITMWTTQILHSTAFGDTLAELVGSLREARVLHDLSPDDADAVGRCIAYAITRRTDPCRYLIERARDALAGTDHVGWDDSDGVVRSLTVAAGVLHP